MSLERKVKMKPGFKIAAVVVFGLAGAYLAIPAEGWTDSRLLAFGLLWFVSGFWVAQDQRIWQSTSSKACSTDRTD